MNKYAKDFDDNYPSSSKDLVLSELLKELLEKGIRR